MKAKITINEVKICDVTNKGKTQYISAWLYVDGVLHRHLWIDAFTGNVKPYNGQDQLWRENPSGL